MKERIRELYTEGKKWYDCPACKGKGKLGITEDSNKLLYHCFKCSVKGKIKRNEFKAPYRRVDTLPVGRYSSTINLPPTVKFTPSSFKLSVLAYLFKYGLTNEDVTRCRVYSCGDSIIFPIYKDKWLVKYQSRNVLNRFIYTEAKPQDIGKGWLIPVEGNKIVVIVEDGISAMKVSRHFPTLCLFGTNLTDTMINQLIEYKTYKVYIWLDNDNWRIVKKRNEMEKILNSVLPGRVRCVKDISDPKHHTDEKILEVIDWEDK